MAEERARDRRRPDRLRRAARPRWAGASRWSCGRSSRAPGRPERRRRSWCSPRCCSPSRPRPPGSGPTTRSATATSSSASHRPRRRAGRGPLLGGDDPLPAARRPDPRRPDVRQRRAAADRDHGLGAAVARRPGGAHRRRRNPRARQDGAVQRLGLEGARPARRRDRDHPRRPDRAARDRDPAASRTPATMAAATSRRSRHAERGGRATSRARTADRGRVRLRARRPRTPTSGRRAEPATTRPRTASDADGQQARAGSPSRRRSTTGCPPPKLLERGKGGPGPGHARPRGRRQGAARGAAPLRRRGEAARRGQRPAREPLRAPARARDQGREGRAASGRPRLRARLHRHPHPGPDPRQEGGRRRGAEPAPAPGAPRRHLRRPAEGRLAARRVARQGRLRAGGVGRPGADAARPGRRHHRLGKVGLHQRDALLDPPARVAERGPPGARRPEAGRAQPLRAAPAPADARWSPTRAWRPTCSPT